VACSLVACGFDVTATSRSLENTEGLGVTGLRVDVTKPGSLDQLRPFVKSGTRVLISIPTTGDGNGMPAVLDALEPAQRIVYLSTTGVYGTQRDVDERTPPSPKTKRELLRVTAERAIAKAPKPLILRPAAIYGPDRGIHASMRMGAFHLMGGGGNYVSRIHVDDLAQHCVAGMLSDVTGAWPVADEEPCTSLEIATFCSSLLHLPMPQSMPPDALGETRRADRRVNGAAIRKALGVTLRYPSYRVGIPACVAAEADPARAF
jgi:nucleoside-diphosphate-sugar epimerase